MDALKLRCLPMALILFLTCRSAVAATYQTVNFSVTADQPEVAERVGKAAELYRRQLAVFWIGKPLPNWSRPCKVAVREGALGAGGQTTFQFSRGEVLNWRMQVQGSLERILDSVLPHEINHTIFACHFRRPLPRWADEGAATLFEHRSEQLKQLALLNEVIRNKNEIISLRDLLSMKEYPKGQRPMLTLYAQGYALADFLVQQKGRHAYLKFISDGERGGWEEAIRRNFDHEGIESLEKNWRGWVLAGMPKLTVPREQMLAANENDADSKAQAAARPQMQTEQNQPTRPRKRSNLPGSTVVRSQSPEMERMADEGSLFETTAKTHNSTLIGEGLALPASAAQPAGVRRPSIQAPVPKRRATHSGPGENSMPEENAASTDRFFDEFSRQSNDSQSVSSQAVTRLRASDAQAADLEPTASTSSEDTTAESNATKSSNAFEFSGTVLPRERKVRSNSTPAWAGFPGQKKSF